MGNVPRYRLHDHLSFCHVEGHVVFLDIDKDQYFRLPEARERAFLAYVKSGRCEEKNLRDLLEHNILTAQPPIPPRTPPTDMQCPTRSAVEETRLTNKVTASALAGVFSAVCSTHLQLKRRRLKTILESLVAYRSARASNPLPLSGHPSDEQPAAAAAAFRRLRLWVPINTCCLLDSIALVRFLARRRLYANIVFGVTGDPFSAHCWVQIGELLLNDTIGNVTAYTPIRTV
jgi:hypothetical protein